MAEMGSVHWLKCRCLNICSTYPKEEVTFCVVQAQMCRFQELKQPNLDIWRNFFMTLFMKGSFAGRVQMIAFEILNGICL